MRNKLFLPLAVLVMALMLSGCDDDGYKPVPPVENNQNNDSTDIFNNFNNTEHNNNNDNHNTNNANNHNPPPDDSEINADGPEITILTPQEGELVNTSTLKVQAIVRSATSTVDFGTVSVYLEGKDHPMTADAQQEDGFLATLSMKDVPDGTVVIRVSAQDIEGRKSYSDRTFIFDSGPRFTIYSPSESGRYHGGTTLLFAVYDPDGIKPDSVQAVIGNVGISLQEVSRSTETAGSYPLMVGYSADIIFDDAMFDPPLSGNQRITVTAENGLGSTATSYADFTVDNDGPVILVTSHNPGDLIGGILNLECQITDPAGVLPSSVYATIGNNDLEYQIPLSRDENSNTYRGTFDTSVLPHTWMWPAIQVFASDVLGNEASIGFEVGLDNTPPIASLDPPLMRYAREDTDGHLQCSWLFDPVGLLAANDVSNVPQVFWLRAQVEDRGNSAPGAAWSPLAKVVQNSVDMYILDDTSAPLVVDTNGDGICDDINPNLIPTIHLTGDPQETLKLDMVPVSPTGSADFTPDPSVPPGICGPGDDDDPPDAMCAGTEGDMTVAIFYTVDHNEPAIYSLPPYDGGDALTCSGSQFDSMANNISEGWACVAVRAVDNVGNVTVSAPLRICIDADQDGSPSECQSLADPPACTGTVDTSTNPPTVTNTPCTPITFPGSVIRRID